MYYLVQWWSGEIFFPLSSLFIQSGSGRIPSELDAFDARQSFRSIPRGVSGGRSNGKENFLHSPGKFFFLWRSYQGGGRRRRLCTLQIRRTDGAIANFPRIFIARQPAAAATWFSFLPTMYSAKRTNGERRFHACNSANSNSVYVVRVPQPQVPTTYHYTTECCGKCSL